MTPRTYRVAPQAESPDTTFDHPAALTNSRIRSGHLRIPCPVHGETDPTLALWVNGVAYHCHTAGLPHCFSWLRPNSSTQSSDCYDDMKPPAYTASGRHLFSGCFARSLLVRKDAPSPQQLGKIASPSRNPQVRSKGGQ